MIDDEPDPLRPVEFNACSKDLSNTRLSILLAQALVRVGDGNADLERVFHDLQDQAVIRCPQCKRDAAFEDEISVGDIIEGMQFPVLQALEKELAGKVRVRRECEFDHIKPLEQASSLMNRIFEPSTYRSEEHTTELHSLMRISYAV